MKRTLFTYLILAGALLCTREAVQAETSPPNIIIISADDLGFGELGCYGQKLIQTPNIDRIAAGGMLFSAFYAGSASGAASRDCLLTGRHSGNTSVRGLGNLPLQADFPTLPQQLRQAGYTTAFIGKWGLGTADSPGSPDRNGFMHYLSPLNRLPRETLYPQTLWRNGESFPLPSNNPSTEKPRANYVPDYYTLEAQEFMTAHKNTTFFLYLSYPVPYAAGMLTSSAPSVPTLDPYAHRMWPKQEKEKAAMITRLDRDIGTLLDQLDQLGIANNTLIIFTSDNGPHNVGGINPFFFHSTGPFRGLKHQLYEGGIRVPLIARWPNNIEMGSQCRMVCSGSDIYPTLCEIAGITLDEEPIDGLSLAPYLLGNHRDQKVHDYLYWEHFGRGFTQAVRLGHWKGIRNGRRSAIELYDLSKDPSEQRNLAPIKRDVVKKIEKIMRRARSDSEAYSIQ